MRLLIIIILIALYGFVHGQKPWQQFPVWDSLKKQIDLHPQVLADKTQGDVIRAQQDNLATLPDPGLGVGIGIQPIETRTGPQQAKLSASQSFPFFGTLKQQAKIYDNRASAAELLAEDTRALKIQELKSLLVNLWYQEQKTNLIRKHIDLLNSGRKVLVSTTSTGQSARVDVIRIENEIDAQRKKLSDSRKATSLLRNRIRILTRYDKPVPEMPDSLKLPVLNVQKADTAAHVKIRALEKHNAAAQEQARYARKKGFPTFTLGVDYLITGTYADIDPAREGQDAAMAFVKFNIPLNRKKYRAMQSEASLKALQFEQRKEAVADQLTDRWEQISTQMQQWQDEYALQKRVSQRTGEALRLTLKNFSTGDVDFETLISLYRQLINAELAQVNARARQYIYLAESDYLQTR